MTKSKSTFPWKWIALGVVVVAAIVAVKFLPVAQWSKELNQYVKGLGPLGVVLYIAIYAAATVLFLPGWIFTVGAGITFGLVLGTVASICGATIGATIAFLIARYVARDAISKRFAKNSKFRSIDKAIGKQGWKMVGLLRLSPLIPFNVSNYLYGLTAIELVPFILASFVGMLPGTLLYVYLGTIGRLGLEASGGKGGGKSPWEYALLGVGLLATIAVTIFVTRIAKNALKKK